MGNKANGKKDEAAKAEKAPERKVLSGLSYDPADPDLPWGLRRFARQLAEFQKKLDESRNAPAGEAGAAYQRHPHLAKAMPGHRLHKAGGRTPLFLLQALSRLERGIRKDADAFDALLGDIKRLEDTIGDIDYWWAFLEKGEQRGLPAEVLAWAANKHAQACGRLEGWLAAGNWVDHKYLADETEVTLRTRLLGDTLYDLDWPKAKKERARIGAFLAERLRKVHGDALTLNMDDLEGGLHELRRKLRWFSIYPRALEGLITLDEKAAVPKGVERYLTPAIVNSGFAKLPTPPAGADALTIPAPLFYALSWVIDDLGRVKDAAQETELIQMGLHATGIRAKPAKWLGKGAIGHHAAGEHARKVLAQSLREDRLLLRMADAFEAQI
jgi:hypothetical protein